MLPIPDKLLRQGVRDMVRISDARMSGTSYGTCVLHVAPESFVGGPLALVREGDLICLDVDRRLLRLEVTDEELAARARAWTAPAPIFERGYGALYSEHIGQADKGCDFDFLARPGRPWSLRQGEPQAHRRHHRAPAGSGPTCARHFPRSPRRGASSTSSPRLALHRENRSRSTRAR